MKSTLLALAALLSAGSALAQGTINFTTLSSSAGINAQIKVQEPGQAAVPVAGPEWNGQLLFAPAGGAFKAVDVAQPFRTGAAAGYILKGAVTVAGVAAGTAGQATLIAFKGASFDAAGAYRGESSAIPLTLGGVGTPPSLPANLVGLQGFTIVVPEPSMVALGLLGASLLVIRRKK